MARFSLVARRQDECFRFASGLMGNSGWLLPCDRRQMCPPKSGATSQSAGPPLSLRLWECHFAQGPRIPMDNMEHQLGSLALYLVCLRRQVRDPSRRQRAACTIMHPLAGPGMLRVRQKQGVTKVTGCWSDSMHLMQVKALIRSKTSCLKAKSGSEEVRSER